jgi:hypothetical protein
MAIDPRYDHAHSSPEPSEPSGNWTGYAAIKYGFIFLIVVAILYFVAAFVIPALGD